MLRQMHLLLISFVMLGVMQNTPAQAQTDEPTGEHLQIQIDVMRYHIAKSESEANNRSYPYDPIVEKAYVETRVKQYQYIRDVMDINLAVLNSNRFASGVVLWLVALVTVAGIGFAGFQLWQGASRNGAKLSSDLEISA